MNDIPLYAIKGVGFYKSKIYHGRYECIAYGRKRIEVLFYIRETFGDEDDLVYAQEYGDEHYTGYDSLLTEEQMMQVILKFA